ncbi:protein of unknown function DUF167 [Methanocaldococcus infernus ME]|uniref:UPF0235 protein Metin_0474 n=1 Tax=Methanocaldococcus infernus (strain DSM 11812 / JCM 15783 / ME) TaxID=573063 RepID=D5VRE1_METIM|nr:DUF167 domain-containing protein [Methanocaldococcus infernus]ADG13144.1 protein of unknown function DUF167 [Methanocaldococcus infernus ME]
MLRECKEGTLLDIIVTPNAKKTEIVGRDEWRNRLEVKVKAPPVEGKANKEIIKFFSKLFGDVEIVAGEKSSKKTILIRKPLKEVEEILNSLI